ncbi:MAG: bifunctional oligoribonuclease/PAP phosphatase NrnA [Clostridia bacterium]|nr:bifunctional oligoribonuclease/PAP phosphatase NrnA [Clostridia bacterium]
MMNDVIELILKSDTINIIAHEEEDADSVGSCFAMQLALRPLGKTVKCCFSAPLEKRIAFMGDDYTVFDANADYTADLCICLDCGDTKRLGNRIKVFESAKNTLSIDHHETNTMFAKTNCVDADASATAEILYGLFCQMGIGIDKDIAKNLYAAISSDTGSFKYSNVTPKTMQIAGELLLTGINHAEIARNLHDTDELCVIRLKAEIMQNIEDYFDGQLTVITADDTLFKKYDVTERDSGDIVDIARSVKGSKIAVSIRETQDKIKVSFRSNCEKSVSGIAKSFGGGGHAKAAGAKITGSTADEVKQEIVKAVGELLNG